MNYPHKNAKFGSMQNTRVPPTQSLMKFRSKCIRTDVLVCFTDGFHLCFIQICPLLRNVSTKDIPDQGVVSCFCLRTFAIRSHWQFSILNNSWCIRARSVLPSLAFFIHTGASLYFIRQRVFHSLLGESFCRTSDIQSTLDNSNTDISISAKFETSI